MIRMLLLLGANRVPAILSSGKIRKHYLMAGVNFNVLFNSELTRRVQSRKTDLELEVREDAIVGETSIVWGCGGVAKLLLFQGDYLGINIRNVPYYWTLSDVDLTVRTKFSQSTKGSIRDLHFLPRTADQNSRTARIVFDNPTKAATAFLVNIFGK